MRNAIVRWDALAKAEKAVRRAIEIGDFTDVPDDLVARREAFEDAFNILIHQFEKEYPNG